MTDDEAQEDLAQRVAWERWLEVEPNTYDFEITRVWLDPGRTISAPALNAVLDEITLYVGSRIARRWDKTNEPPSAVLITVTVDVH